MISDFGIFYCWCHKGDLEKAQGKTPIAMKDRNTAHELPAHQVSKKQLWDVAEYDSENYQGRGLCYLPKPKAETDNANRGLDDSRCHAKTESNNCLLCNCKSRSCTKTRLRPE